MQFNYSPTYGNPLTASYTHGYTSAPGSYNGFTWPGSWTQYSAYQSGSYFYVYQQGRAVSGIKGGGGNQCITLDWNANGWDASRPFIYNYNSARYGGYSYNTGTNYSTATGTASVSGEKTFGFWPDTAAK